MVHLFNMWGYHYPLFIKMCICTFITQLCFLLLTLFQWSYCVEVFMCVINMKFLGDVLVQQIFKYICYIQNIYTFKHAWEIFDMCHCDLRLWTLAPCPWHIHTWHRSWWEYRCIKHFQAYSWHPKYIGL